MSKYENAGLAVISELAHQFFSDNFCLRPGWLVLLLKQILGKYMYAVAQLGEALCYKPEGRGFDS
jgi:hypothetical protein